MRSVNVHVFTLLYLCAHNADECNVVFKALCNLPEHHNVQPAQTQAALDSEPVMQPHSLRPDI